MRSVCGKEVVAVGCLVERYREELNAGIPEVAGWFGLLGGDEDSGLLLSAHGGPEVGGEALSRVHRGGSPGDLAKGPEQLRSFAYLKISDGCDEPCTFCAIPGIKGTYHSFAAEEVLREADACLAEGVRELVLVGQDTSLWAGTVSISRV